MKFHGFFHREGGGKGGKRKLQTLNHIRIMVNSSLLKRFYSTPLLPSLASSLSIGKKPAAF
jgi:hypothetical protein